MKKIKISVEQFVTKYHTTDAEMYKLINLGHGIQCPICFNLLDNKRIGDLVEIELCDCYK